VLSPLNGDTGSRPGSVGPAEGSVGGAGEPSQGGDLRLDAFDGSGAEWDALTRELEGRAFCHLGSWRGVMSEVMGHSLHYRVAADGAGRIHGALPMVRVRSWLFGDYLVSMPFLSYGGPLGARDAQAFLAQEAAREAQSLGVDLLELRSRTPVPGALRTSERKLSVLLPLPESAEELWEKGLPGKVRSQVRRPMKEGMEARFGSELLGSFYTVFSRTMRGLGTPVLPAEFFRAVVAGMPEQVVVGAVFWKGDPVAAGFGFLWDGEVEITWAGALREVSRMAPNMLLYWSFMEEAIRRGARTFNFGRCSPGSGTHRFKLQWGGQDHPLPWAHWSPGSVSATPTPTGRKYQFATAVWSRLPLSVTNRLGPRLSRGLP
jgi:serine/alanine adding enzyme